MKVNISTEQAEVILGSLKNDHLCNICQYDEQHNIIKGTECALQKLIQKFEKVADGTSHIHGLKGGIVANLQQKRKERDIECATIDRVYKDIVYRTKQEQIQRNAPDSTQEAK